jgi:hypothetical protein
MYSFGMVVIYRRGGEWENRGFSTFFAKGFTGIGRGKCRVKSAECRMRRRAGGNGE